MSDNNAPYGAMRNYVAAFEEVAPPPPYIDAPQPQQTIVSDATIGTIAVSANLAVTIIVIAIMLVNGAQAGLAVQRGILYFGISTPLYLLIITGGLVAVVNAWQRERTERQRTAAYERVVLAAIEWRVAVEHNRTAELQAQAMPSQLTRRIATLEHELLTREIAADPLHTPATFVTPYDNRSQAAHVDAPRDSSAQEAMAWLVSLYDAMGQPDAGKVQMVGDDLGRLKVRMLGSKRGGGSREAGLWCIQRGVIKRVPGGYKLRLDHYPTRESLRQLL